MLLPPPFVDLLPKDHEVFFVRETVQKADLGEIYNSYTSTKGQPPSFRPCNGKQQTGWTQ